MRASYDATKRNTAFRLCRNDSEASTDELQSRLVTRGGGVLAVPRACRRIQLALFDEPSAPSELYEVGLTTAM